MSINIDTRAAKDCARLIKAAAARLECAEDKRRASVVQQEENWRDAEYEKLKATDLRASAISTEAIEALHTMSKFIFEKASQAEAIHGL